MVDLIAAIKCTNRRDHAKEVATGFLLLLFGDLWWLVHNKGLDEIVCCILINNLDLETLGLCQA